MRQKGIVLFMTMITLSIVTLLILSLMQATLLYVKASNQLIQRHHAFYQLEAAANQLGVFSIRDSRCMVSDKDPNEVVELLQRQHGCTTVVEQQSYRYLVEDLGVYSCLRIKSGRRLQSSHHWLLSVTTGGPTFELLQLRIARKVDLAPCDGRSIIINEGVVSWRHLLG